MSKLFDASLKNANVKEDSINSTFREIAYTYCLESKLGREIASEQLAQMRINYFNTKERLLTWAQTQINFAGQAVVLDTDEANYAKYCN